MYAVLTEVDTSGQPDPALGLKVLQEQIVPGARETPGFRAGYWLRPLEDAKGTSLVLYDTEENAQVAAQGLAVGSSPMSGIRVVRNEVRAIAASA
jgi:hypothetical protein